MHTRLPSVLTCKRLVGSDKQKTTSPRKNLLFFCLTSLFANLLARIPSVCHAAQICKPPSQSKKYLRPPLSERIFLLSRKFVRHVSTLHCLLRGRNQFLSRRFLFFTQHFYLLLALDAFKYYNIAITCRRFV